MRIAPLAEVKTQLSAYIQRSATDGPVVITRNGRAVAVLLTPFDDDDLERLILARSPRFQHLLGRSRRSLKAGRGLSRGRFWKTVASQSQPKTASEKEDRRPSNSDFGHKTCRH
jgi:prevent-host-death family protein